MLNRCEFIGNVGTDPQIIIVGKDNKKASFRLASTERYTDSKGEKKEKTTWVNVVIWGGLATVAEKFVKKGSKLFIAGKLDNREYTTDEGEKKYITEIVVSELELLDKKED